MITKYKNWYDEWFSNWLRLMREYESKKQKKKIRKILIFYVDD